MREGWNRMIRNAGGHLHTAHFIECTADFGFDMYEAKWLFAVLDSDQRRFLTEFDRLRFLSHWDPGQVPDMSLQELMLTTHVPKKKSAPSAKQAEKLEMTTHSKLGGDSSSS